MRSHSTVTSKIWVFAAVLVLVAGAESAFGRKDGQPAAAAPAPRLTVHYHRYDGDYASVGLWTWGEAHCKTPAHQEVFPTGSDEFGSIFTIELEPYACPTGKIGLLPRLNGSWDHKDGPDRFWQADLGRDVYIVFGDAKIYPHMPDVSPKLASAVMSSDLEVSARFTHSLPIDAMAPSLFTLFDRDGREVKLAGVAPVAAADGKASAFAVQAAGPLDPASGGHRLRVQGYGEAQVQWGTLLADADRYFAPDAAVGATCTAAKTEFVLFAPTARRVSLVLSDRPVGEQAVEQPMTRAEKGLWRLRLPGDHRGKFYSFRLAGLAGASGELADPAAMCASGAGARALLVDPRETNPPGFDARKHPPLAAPTDAVIYEMSVRDLTMAANSGVSHKGLYLGLAEPGTHLEGDPSIRTGLDHLVELGVTHVQLMPIQDFDNDETDRVTYNWGYVPVLFSSPDGWFATNPVGPARMRELKAAIQALHDRGIGVTMDVVYNHTALVASLESIVPGYYYRLTGDGRLSNGSGCGNEFHSEQPMAKKLMLDSLRFWVREYGIDGFRFDLMGLHAPETMLAVRDMLRQEFPQVLIYGEPWTGGATPLPRIFDKGLSRGTGIAAFNDHFRDAIKGDRDGGGPGFIQTGDRADGVRRGITGAIDDWAQDPVDAIQYCEAHDNLTTWDKLLQSAGHRPADVRARMQRFAGLIVLTSQGIPFLHSGQELCRSKRGNHNSYNAPDEINRIDWALKKAHADVFAYYRGLIALRKSHPAFRLRTAEEVRRRVAFLEAVPNPKCIAYTLQGKGLGGENFEQILVLMNGDAENRDFVLPPGRWGLYADSDAAGTVPLRDVADKLSVAAHSGAVLAR